MTKTVDKTQVTGSDVFIYTINATFPGVGEPQVTGYIEEFFPSNVAYTLPPITGSLQDIYETAVEGGTIVTFDFGELVSGASVNYTIGASFGLGRRNADVFINSAAMYQNGELLSMDSAQPVVLTLESDFSLSKRTITSTDPKAGEEAYFQLILENNGDGGATLSTISITDTLPTELTPDLNYSIVGYDQSSDFPDTTYDNLTTTWTGTSFTFDLPEYSGERYVIEVHTLVDLRVTPGVTLTNVATWTADGEEQDATSADITVYIDKAEGLLRKLGPNTASIGGPIQYEVVHANRGTVPLSDYLLTEQVPDGFLLENIRCFSNENLFEVYSLYVTTVSDPTTEILVADNLTGNSETYHLADFISTEETVNSVLWKATEALVSTSTSRLHLQGTIRDTATEGDILSNTVTLTASSTIVHVDLSAEKSTTLDNRSGLEVRKTLLSTKDVFYPLDELTFELRAMARNYQTVDPVFVDILPPELTLATGEMYYVYYDAFSRTTSDSRNADYAGPLPTNVTTVNDFNEPDYTLVRFDFSGFTLPYRNFLSVHFHALVSLGATTAFSNTGYLGNPSNDAIVLGTAYLDTLDLDDDTYTDEDIAQSNTVSGTILYTNEFSIEKFVQGSLDTHFSKSGTTTAGGDATYELFITNNQDAELYNIELVDIFPYIGDTGVVQVDVERGSQFPVYPITTATAEILNIIGGTVEPDPTITVEYSTSYDPIRYNLEGNTIGTGTWSVDPPTDISTIASIKVTTGEDVILQPYERLVITLTVVTPDDAPIGDVAYNSFSVRADVTTTEGPDSLLPTEPEKVGITIVADTVGTIGQFVWEDLNEDGIWDDDEPKINGVTVELYDSDGTFLATTITADRYTGESGYYAFTDLHAGSYQVKFIPDSGDTLTIQNLDSTVGSRPDPDTGLTPTFTLYEGEQLYTINAGMIRSSCEPPTIYAVDESIPLYTDFNPLTHVTASDCSGTDLTADIIVTENTVDTSVSGTYFVTYQVTDSLGQTTTKTITVTVETEAQARAQAITDLMESIALEETGIQTILHGEGAKIQRAVALDLSTEDLLAVNASVESMVKHLTTLEQVLYTKLELAVQVDVDTE